MLITKKPKIPIFYSNKWAYTEAGEIAFLISQIFQKKNTPKKEASRKYLTDFQLQF